VIAIFVNDHNLIN